MGQIGEGVTSEHSNEGDARKMVTVGADRRRVDQSKISPAKQCRMKQPSPPVLQEKETCARNSKY